MQTTVPSQHAKPSESAEFTFKLCFKEMGRLWQNPLHPNAQWATPL